MSRYVPQPDRNHSVDHVRYHSRDRQMAPTDGYRQLLRPETLCGLLKLNEQERETIRNRVVADSGREYVRVEE